MRNIGNIGYRCHATGSGGRGAAQNIGPTSVEFQPTTVTDVRITIGYRCTALLLAQNIGPTSV